MSNEQRDIILKELATEEFPQISTYFAVSMGDSSVAVALSE